MRFALLALAGLSGCDLFGPPCEVRADAVAVRLAALAPFAAEVDPWARPDAQRVVPLDRLARVDLPYHASHAERDVSIDASGQRWVDSVAIGPERAALCAALGTAPDSGHAPVRVHADGEARASAVVEFLADLHSCKVYRLDIALAREQGLVIARSSAPVPADPPDCPIDRASVAAAPFAEQPARLAEVLVSAQKACGCPLGDEEVVAAWQAAALPETFVTALSVRPSPSAVAFEVNAEESWQDAAQRLLVVAGPAPFAHPVLMWFANEGSLAPVDFVPGLPR